MVEGPPPPPGSRAEVVVDTIHGVEFPDPYRWLEDGTSAEVVRWVETQNAYAERVIGNPPIRSRLEARLRELMDREDMGSPRRAGDYEYFTMRRVGEELGSVYRRPAPEKGEDVPIDSSAEYEVVLDPLASSPDGTTSLDIQAFSPDGDILVYGIRDGGTDEYEIRVRDLASGEDLPARWPPMLYSGISFASDGTGFYYSRRDRTEGTRVLFHRIGTEAGEDEVLFGGEWNASTFIEVEELEDGRYRLYSVRHGPDTSELHLEDVEAGTIRPIVEGEAARFYHRVRDGQIYLRTNLGADLNRLMAVPVSASPRSNWREVTPEGDDLMDDFTFIDGRIYVRYLHHASSRIRVYEMDGTPASEIEVPPFHSASIRGSGPGEALLTLSSFLSPAEVWKIDLATGERTLHEPANLEWDGSEYVVDQVWHTSPDGTEAPNFIVHHRDIELDGSNPTILTGYGGFYVSRTPSFNPLAAAWLEMGGVYAMATLRGGSEYGESWHRDGMLTNKQNVFDDFISAAEWLIDNGYTSREKLAIQGASNAGLLVAAAMTQRPELFRAVLCYHPDVDILRFPWYYHSNSPPALLEYGDSRIPEHFEAIRHYSPLQNIRENTAYPAVLFHLGELDTRVPPQGARKMTAHLQAASTSGHPVILDFDYRAGHAGGRPMSRWLRVRAMQLGRAVTLVLALWSWGCAGGGGGERASAAASLVRTPAELVIRDVRVFDGERVLERATVVVRDGRIAAVGTGLPVPAADEVVDGAGRTLLPGLIDAHTHTRADSQLEASLAFGVTTVLDMFTNPELAAGWRRGQAEDGAPGRADLFSAGTVATAAGGHGSRAPIPTVDSVGAAAPFVAERIAQGSDYLKIVIEDLAKLGRELPSLDAPRVTALVAAAHDGGILAVAHVGVLADAEIALAAGADGLVHLWADQPPSPGTARRMAEVGMFVVPTLTILERTPGRAGGATLIADERTGPLLDPEAVRNLEAEVARPDWYDTVVESLRALHRAGVAILAGSDAPNPGTTHGASMHRELELLVAAGLTPVEALRAATSAPADAFRLDDRGRIRPGARADLVLVEGDPTADIMATRAIRAVWKRGVRFDHEAYATRMRAAWER
jgi:prolyl oligopeptidase